MEYKGYYAAPKYQEDTKTFYGEVLDTNDVITFEADNVADLEEDFQHAVDDYLAFCAKVGKTPDKPYSGKFQVRLGPQLHKKAAICAKQEGVSLNDYVKEAVEKYVCIES